MAKYQVVCVRDRPAGVFGLPVCVAHLAVAIRSFGDEINRKDSALSAHPDDYSLWHVGTFDDISGCFEGVDHRMLASGSDMRNNG